MKRLSVLILLIALLLSVTIVAHAQSATLAYDLYCILGGSCTDDTNDLLLNTSGSPGGGCTTTWAPYIQWESVTGGSAITDVNLTLTFGPATDFGGPYTFELREVTSDTWDETTTTDIGFTTTVLATQTASPAADGDTITFSGATLASYFETARTGDNQASLAVVMTAGCSAGTTLVQFYDNESGANAPSLVLNPTAVSLTDVSASSDGPNPTLWIGLFVVVALLGFLVFAYSTKQEQHGES